MHDGFQEETSIKRLIIKAMRKVLVFVRVPGYENTYTQY